MSYEVSLWLTTSSADTNHVAPPRGKKKSHRPPSAIVACADPGDLLPLRAAAIRAKALV